MIRLTSIELNGFKNVMHGEIALSSWKKGASVPEADIVGIYGQNGSGKTSVIQALKILKSIYLGDNIQKDAADCISKTSDSAEVVVKGVLFDEQLSAEMSFVYNASFGEGVKGPMLLGEELACKDLSQADAMHTLLAYSPRSESNYACEIAPKQFWREIVSLSEDAKTELAVVRRLASANSSSFVFSSDFMALLGKLSQSAKEKVSKANSGHDRRNAVLIAQLQKLVSSLKLFALTDLAVIGASQYASSMLNDLHISTHEGKGGALADASFIVNLSRPTKLDDKRLNDLRATIEKMSPVLSALVPGLSLGVFSLGKLLDDDGFVVESVEITCTRGGTTVPLRCESEGIKKLVSILTLLIDVYSKPGACVAIDELDSGVFEFLLGEILQVLQNHGRGQLIFTAHNLRPLETLNKGALVFTTTNPERRYIKFRGSREKSNLRSQYLRAINLGGQSEKVYEPTNVFDIDSAFYDAVRS
ncbi:AAA family ATPase [Bifidobacterium oedipodis]|uniref:AAA domain, putative AbiEii toxin, Type IV TA system n=1 Tax=Bifidobacterium oedipodis TaxID=2675322 RepID=A0A7Y0ERV0_9BIFI|nr:AAA family ATPase [Bifidobacterium sp. DSM 109957]NMM95260.1 AAA domain, putative AbiEii toxin, Type IV TA system [Bifidobacterium sp. DSM 109957]